MVPRKRYRLKQHHTFEQEDRKYVADLETGDLVQINDVEWDVLSRYATQTPYRIVQQLKRKYKLIAIFEAFERLERLAQQGTLLSPIVEPVVPPAADPKPPDGMPKVLVPFQFTEERFALDYLTGLNRYKFLKHLSAFVALETLVFSEIGAEKKAEVTNLDEVRVRNIDVPKSSAMASPWYALNGYDGILLLSQFLTDDLLYYRVPDVPIVHCIEGLQQLRHLLPKTLLTLSAFQRSKDTLVVKASWMKEWLVALGAPVENVRVIPDGIDVVAPIGDKMAAKQHTADIFEKHIFLKHPVVGLISGFEPHRGARWIATFARANPHLAIFVYDTMLAEHYRNPPDNVVIFRADDAETLAVLPLCFQALDLVCFPAMPGTPLSIVLQAMAYGAPCVAMTKSEMPIEVAGAGGTVQADWDHFGNFHVSMPELSRTLNKWLSPAQIRSLCDNFTERILQQRTPQNAAQAISQLFTDGMQRQTADAFAETTQPTLFPPIFSRRYEPETGTLKSCAYRFGIGRDDDIETALAEILAQQHTPAEVEAVFKHFQRSRQ